MQKYLAIIRKEDNVNDNFHSFVLQAQVVRFSAVVSFKTHSKPYITSFPRSPLFSFKSVFNKLQYKQKNENRSRNLCKAFAISRKYRRQLLHWKNSVVANTLCYVAFYMAQWLNEQMIFETFIQYHNWPNDWVNE